MDFLRLMLCGLLLASSASALATPPPMPPAKPGAAAKTITLQTKPAVVGQSVEQTVEVSLSLKSQSRQGQQVLEKAESQMQQQRQRHVETTAVSGAVATAARVKYLVSQRKQGESKVIRDPVEGKTYLCRRLSDRLEVLTERGKMPTAEEFQIVSENMETLGRPNPLAQYLTGKAVTTGQTLKLPPAVAKRLFGLKKDFGEVTRFELTLRDVKPLNGQDCAVFQAEIEAQRTDSSQMRLVMAGPIVIEGATCRAISTQLSGPIGMSRSLPDPRGRVQVDSTGNIRVRVASRFSDNPR